MTDPDIDAYVQGDEQDVVIRTRQGSYLLKNDEARQLQDMLNEVLKK